MQLAPLASPTGTSTRQKMPCYHPIPAYRTEAGEIRIRKADDLYNVGKPLHLPCGSCIGCRKSLAQGWALRCHLEAARHNHVGFATLTFDDKNLQVTLSRRTYQLFVKRLRRSMPARTLRHFGCGEYGETNGRPHYHALLFGTYDAAAVEKAWGLGFTKTVRATPRAIAYVAGYTAKKIGWQLEVEERIDYSTGEIYTWQPPFIQMSRNPGIGAHARQWVNSWRSEAIYNGKRQPVPRFLHEAWKAQATEEEIEALALEKEARAQRRASDKPDYDRRAAEAIAVARQQQQASRRPL